MQKIEAALFRQNQLYDLAMAWVNALLSGDMALAEKCRADWSALVTNNG
jgi:hypothetical protein